MIPASFAVSWSNGRVTAGNFSDLALPIQGAAPDLVRQSGNGRTQAAKIVGIGLVEHYWLYAHVTPVALFIAVPVPD